MAFSLYGAVAIIKPNYKSVLSYWCQRFDCRIL